jgi:hypothetical protein
MTQKFSNNALRNSCRKHLFTHRDHYWQKAGRHVAIRCNGYRYPPPPPLWLPIKWFCFTRESLHLRKKTCLYLNCPRTCEHKSVTTPMLSVFKSYPLYRLESSTLLIGLKTMNLWGTSGSRCRNLQAPCCWFDTHSGWIILQSVLSFRTEYFELSDWISYRKCREFQQQSHLQSCPLS